MQAGGVRGRKTHVVLEARDFDLARLVLLGFFGSGFVAEGCGFRFHG